MNNQCIKYLNSQLPKMDNGEHDIFCISETEWLLKAQTKKFIDNEYTNNSEKEKLSKC